MLLFMVALLSASKCAPDTGGIDEGTTDNYEKAIIGKWQCDLDAYGDPWDEPLIFQFYSDGTGYQWFTEEPFSDRWEFSYLISVSKLKIKTQYGTYDLRYDLSSNNNTLILYGWDDNDMEELWFKRVK